MADISSYEMIQNIKKPDYNSKCNNYIYTNVNDINGVLSSIPDISEINNYHRFRYEGNIGDQYLHNIIVDMNVVSPYQLLDQALDVLGQDQRISFDSITDIMKLRGVLRKLKTNIQYIIINANKLTYDDVKRLNDLIYFTSYFICESLLFKPGEDLISYQTTNGSVLDYRENYNKLRVR